MVLLMVVGFTSGGFRGNARCEGPTPRWPHPERRRETVQEVGVLWDRPVVVAGSSE